MNRKMEFTLRQRKYARTKLALKSAAMEGLKGKSLEEITVRELCAAAEVSEATFFNYFPEKTDLLAYVVQLWSLEAGWHAQRALAEGSGLRAIEALFEFAARWWADNPEVMAEMVAWQARRRVELPLGEITAVERANAFPELEGVEQLEAESIATILQRLIDKAMEQGELPDATEPATVAAALMAILFGSTLVQRSVKGAAGRDIYGRQLRLIWAGLDARKETRPAAGRRYEATGGAFSWS